MGLVVSTDFFADEMLSLQKAWVTSVDEKKRLDPQASGIIRFDTMESVLRDMIEKVKQVKTSLSTLYNTKTPEPPACSECRGTVFNTSEDGREVCAKCGLERK